MNDKTNVEIRKELIELFYDDFFNNLEGKQIYIDKNDLKSFRISDVKVYDLKLPLGNKVIFDNNDLNNPDFINFKEKLKAKLLQKKPLFYSASNSAVEFNNVFFKFITNQNNLEKTWGTIENDFKREVFDILLKKRSDVIAKLIKIIKPEDYIKVFRLVFKRETQYVDKEPLTFIEKMEKLNKLITEEDQIWLFNSLYDNSKSMERNMLAAYILSAKEKSTLSNNIISNCNFKFEYEKNKDKEALNNINDLLDETLVLKNEIQFNFSIPKKLMLEQLNNFINEAYLEQFKRYFTVKFNYKNEDIEISNESTFIKKNYDPNFTLSMRVNRNTPFTKKEENHRFKIFKMWFLKTIEEDIREVASLDKTSYRTIDQTKAWLRFGEIDNEVRKNDLLDKLDESEKPKLLGKKYEF